jgi:ankyrin repeat protein
MAEATAQPDQKTWNLTLRLMQRLMGGGAAEDMLQLIAGGAQLTVRNAEQMTPLILAAAHKLTPVMTAMLQCGREAAVDARDDHGWTALITAAHRGDAEGIKLLLDAGADVTVKDQMGRDALYYAEGSKDAEKIKLIRHAMGEAAFIKGATVAAKPVAVMKPLKIKP